LGSKKLHAYDEAIQIEKEISMLKEASSLNIVH
jgi:hypothetical protein